jgi:hypothetical protein
VVESIIHKNEEICKGFSQICGASWFLFVYGQNDGAEWRRSVKVVLDITAKSFAQGLYFDEFYDKIIGRRIPEHRKDVDIWQTTEEVASTTR